MNWLLFCVLALLIRPQYAYASPLQRFDARLQQRQASGTLGAVFQSPAPTGASTSTGGTAVSNTTPSAPSHSNSSPNASRTQGLPITRASPSSSSSTASPIASSTSGGDNSVSDLFVPGTKFFPLGIVVICLIIFTFFGIILALFFFCCRRAPRPVPSTENISKHIPPQTPPFVQKHPIAQAPSQVRSSIVVIGPAFNYFANKRKSSALPALPYSARALSFSSFGSTASSSLPTPDAPVTGRPESTFSAKVPEEKHMRQTSGLFSAGPTAVWDVQTLAYQPDSTISRVPPTPLPTSFPKFTPVEPKSNYIEVLETPVQGPSIAATLPTRAPSVSLSPAIARPPSIPSRPTSGNRPHLSRLTIPEPILPPRRRTPVVAVPPNLERLEEETSEPAQTARMILASPPRPLPRIPPPAPAPRGPLPPPPVGGARMPMSPPPGWT